ncbi:MAG: hypothetical protein QOE61_3324 [Micromonosporaceae bacterium]|nr:hypothetical protein [Micromonosporaceae bacterium]
MNPADDSPATIGTDRPRRAPRPDPTDVKEPWLLRTGTSITVWLLAGVATVLAASGQIEFAHWAGITDIRAYAVPAVLELVAIAFLLIGYRRARRGDSPAAMWLLAAGIGGFAVYTNVSHSGRAGLVFGVASAITLLDLPRTAEVAAVDVVRRPAAPMAGPPASLAPRQPVPAQVTAAPSVAGLAGERGRPAGTGVHAVGGLAGSRLRPAGRTVHRRGGAEPRRRRSVRPLDDVAGAGRRRPGRGRVRSAMAAPYDIAGRRPRS